MMSYLVIILKLIVGLGILNVWLIRFNRASTWRGGEAKNMMEEFSAYGLPAFMTYVIGVLKVGLAIVLLISIYYINLTLYAAIGIAILMLGAILMHVRIGDSIKKSAPAFIMLLLCGLIYWLH